MNINDAAEIVMEAEEAALKSILTLVNACVDGLAEVKETLPTSLALDASRIIGEVLNNLSYVRTSSLPMAIRKYDPAAVPTMTPEYVPPAPSVI